MKNERGKNGQEMNPTHNPVGDFVVSRRDLLKMGIVVTTAERIVEQHPPIRYPQDPLPPVPTATPDNKYDNADSIPPREVLVTKEDVEKAYENLNPYQKTYVYTNDNTNRAFSLFSEHPRNTSWASAWDHQHIASALQTYRELRDSLPAHMPEPTVITGAFWNQYGRPHYSSYPFNSNTTSYVDDGAWLGNIDADACKYAKDKQDTSTRAKFARSRSSMMFQSAVNNKDADGGIYWVIQPHRNKDIAAVSNGPIVLLGTKLASIDPDYKDYYLEESKKVYNWMRDTLLDPNTHLYADRQETHKGIKTIIKDYTSYGQAHMIEAGFQLAKLTGDDKFAQDAEKTAFSVLTQGDMYTNPTVYFDAILIKSLYKVYQETTNKGLQELIRDRIVLYGNNLVRNGKIWDRPKGKYNESKLKGSATLLQSQSASAEILLITHALSSHTTASA